MSIVKNGRKILSNVIDTQISIHEKFGGVVPEIASRNHVEAISTVMKKAVADANININDIDAVKIVFLNTFSKTPWNDTWTCQQLHEYISEIMEISIESLHILQREV